MMSWEVSTGEAEEFLYDEADLLDDRRYADWVSLFAPDGVYWVPSGHAGVPETSLAIIYDPVPRLKERVLRLESKQCWAQNPPTLTSRLVGNVVSRQCSQHEVEVRSRVVISFLRRHEHNFLSARCSYRLVRTADGLRISEKVVRLLERDEFFANLTFIL